jgi:hypothetical protein
MIENLRIYQNQFWTKNFLFYPIHMAQKTFHDPVLEGKRFIGGGDSIPELKTSFSFL